MNAIRTEVQVTPSYKIGYGDVYYYSVYQVVEGVRVNLATGFATSPYLAHIEVWNKSKQFI